MRETLIGCLQHSPQPGVRPATFLVCGDKCSNQLSRPTGATPNCFYVLSVLPFSPAQSSVLKQTDCLCADWPGAGPAPTELLPRRTARGPDWFHVSFPCFWWNTEDTLVVPSAFCAGRYNAEPQAVLAEGVPCGCAGGSLRTPS